MLLPYNNIQFCQIPQRFWILQIYQSNQFSVSLVSRSMGNWYETLSQIQEIPLTSSTSLALITSSFVAARNCADYTTPSQMLLILTSVIARVLLPSKRDRWLDVCFRTCSFCSQTVHGRRSASYTAAVA